MLSHVPSEQKGHQKAHHWIGEVAMLLDTGDRDLACEAMRSVLVGVRERVGEDSAEHFAAQLPDPIREMFYEGYRPIEQPSRERTRDAFLAKINNPALGGRVEPERAVKAVLKVVSDHIDAHEVYKVTQLFPKELRDFWPDVSDRVGKPET